MAGFMVRDVELGKSGRKVFRVAREEVSMDAVKRSLDLRTTWTLN